jgi:hypothetical protein
MTLRCTVRTLAKFGSCPATHARNQRVLRGNREAEPDMRDSPRAVFHSVPSREFVGACLRARFPKVATRNVGEIAPRSEQRAGERGSPEREKSEEARDRRELLQAILGGFCVPITAGARRAKTIGRTDWARSVPMRLPPRPGITLHGARPLGTRQAVSHSHSAWPAPQI